MHSAFLFVLSVAVGMVLGLGCSRTERAAGLPDTGDSPRSDAAFDESPDDASTDAGDEPDGDAGMRLARTARDEGCDGTDDSSCVVYSYGARGNETRAAHDADCDGTPEYCMFSNSAVDQSSPDEGCDGELEWDCVEVEYDDAGRILRMAQDADCDGAPESDCNSYTYDDSGFLIGEMPKPAVLWTKTATARRIATARRGPTMQPT